MSNLTLEDRTHYDVRWQCLCGRFVSESAIKSVDHLDPDAFYGITTVSTYQCGRCGKRDGLPRCVAVREIVLPEWGADALREADE